jgi:Vacuolar protein sorting-associated protein 62
MKRFATALGLLMACFALLASASAPGAFAQRPDGNAPAGLALVPDASSIASSAAQPVLRQRSNLLRPMLSRPDPLAMIAETPMQEPALELAYTAQFALEWWDAGSGGDFDGAFYRPVVPSGFYALGHYGQANYALPNGGMYVVRELESGALAQPTDYTMVWGDYGSGAAMDGSFWKPIPPAGYVCLGLVAQTGYSKPGMDEIRCVREDLTRPGIVGPMVWNDQGTGAHTDFGSWFVIPADEMGVYVGTFTGQASHNPPTFPVYVLSIANIEKEMPTVELELAYVDDYELEWRDVGSGGDLDGAYYRPVVPSGYYALGHYGQGNYVAPVGPMFAARELQPGALAQPIDYTMVWGDYGSGADMDGSFWKPIPPTGYVCLGLVAQTGYAKPGLDEIRCVRQDLTCPGKVGSMIWIDQGTGADTDFGSWRIVPSQDSAVYVGTFAGYSSHTPPPDILFALDSRAVSGVDPLTSSDVDGLIQQYGPTLYLHPEEAYYMDEPEWVLDHGVSLTFALVENEWDYDAHTRTFENAMPTTSHTLMDNVDYVISVIKPNPPYNGSESFRFWLHIPDALKAGEQSRAQALVRVLPWNTFFTELQFWFFYPFNGPGRVEVCLSGEECTSGQLTTNGRHYGDWEHVTLRFLNSGKALVSVFMSAHGGGYWFGAGEFGNSLKFSGWHPIVYSAKYSHAHYPSAGRHDYERIVEYDYGLGTFSVDLFDLTGTGSQFETYTPGHYRVISSGVFPVKEPDWLRFEGRWGQYEKLSTAFDYVVYTYEYEEVAAGPTGPAMKTAWHRGDFADQNGWPREPLGVEWAFVHLPNISKAPFALSTMPTTGP